MGDKIEYSNVAGRINSGEKQSRSLRVGTRKLPRPDFREEVVTSSNVSGSQSLLFIPHPKFKYLKSVSIASITTSETVSINIYFRQFSTITNTVNEDVAEGIEFDLASRADDATGGDPKYLHYGLAIPPKSTLVLDYDDLRNPFEDSHTLYIESTPSDVALQITAVQSLIPKK